jgi:UPF0755 protein
MGNNRLLIVFRNLFIAAALAVTLLTIVLLGFIFVAYGNRSGLNPVEAFFLNISLALRSADLSRPLGADSAPVCFTVNRGDTAGSIAARLAEQGFAVDADLFRSYVRFFGIDDELQAGVFSLRRTFTLPEVAQQLTNAGANTVNFLIPEGWRLEEIAARIDGTPGLNFTGADFVALVGPGAGNIPGAIGEFAARVGLPPGRSLEGFLFPDTYTLPACGTAADLVLRMLQNFDARVTAQMRADAQATGLSLYQIVTLAAIVQRETLIAEEGPVIAGVYLNRYRNAGRAAPDPRIPVTLDADPTIQYALGNTRDPATWWPPLTRADYRGVDSPYNTYLYAGLPPGPIANPGLNAIRSAIYPQQHEYAFFRTCAGDGGRHRFSLTFEEHAAACP